MSNYRKEMIERLKAIDREQSLVSLLASPSETTMEPPAKAAARLSDLEFAALVVIFEEEDAEPVSFWSVHTTMERMGYTKAAAKVAAKSLMSKNMLDMAIRTDREGDPYEAYSVTGKGTEHVTANVDRLQVRKQSKAASLASRLQDEDLGDIPF